MATSRLITFVIAVLCMLPAGCVLKEPQIKLDTAKYGDVIDVDASSPGVLIRRPARDVYDLKYFLARNHKAIAQSRSGAWAWTHRHATLEEALDRALELCRDRNGADEKQQPCKLVNVDSWWASEIPQR